jgi:hypothetical protein
MDDDQADFFSEGSDWLSDIFCQWYQTFCIKYQTTLSNTAYYLTYTRTVSIFYMGAYNRIKELFFIALFCWTEV